MEDEPIDLVPIWELTDAEHDADGTFEFPMIARSARQVLMFRTRAPVGTSILERVRNNYRDHRYQERKALVAQAALARAERAYQQAGARARRQPPRRGRPARRHGDDQAGLRHLPARRGEGVVLRPAALDPVRHPRARLPATPGAHRDGSSPRPCDAPTPEAPLHERRRHRGPGHGSIAATAPSARGPASPSPASAARSVRACR